MTGTIAKLVSERGYGFLTPDGGRPNIFFHCSGCANDGAFYALNTGDRVQYELTDSPKGPVAIRVRPVEAS